MRIIKIDQSQLTSSSLTSFLTVPYPTLRSLSNCRVLLMISSQAPQNLRLVITFLMITLSTMLSSFSPNISLSLLYTLLVF